MVRGRQSGRQRKSPTLNCRGKYYRHSKGDISQRRREKKAREKKKAEEKIAAQKKKESESIEAKATKRKVEVMTINDSDEDEGSVVVMEAVKEVKEVKEVKTKHPKPKGVTEVKEVKEVKPKHAVTEAVKEVKKTKHGVSFKSFKINHERSICQYLFRGPARSAGGPGSKGFKYLPGKEIQALTAAKKHGREMCAKFKVEVPAEFL